MEDWYVVSVTIILLFVIVIILAVWEYTLDKNYKNTPIVNYSKPSEQTINPSALLLDANQSDFTQNSSGLQAPSLHQPCNPGTEQTGVPNLPVSYTTNCSEGQACVNSTTRGNVCLSKLGYFCKNKMDCDPTTTDECVGNICVSRTNKLNAPCNDNSDCFLSSNNTNLSCVQTDSGKRCKYDLYPLGNKCAFDQECYPNTNNQEYACVQAPSSDYIVTGTGNNQGNIVLNEGMSLLVYSFVNNIEDKKVKLINNQTGMCSYYQITNFSLEDYSFTPIYYPTSTPEMSSIDNGTCYNILFYEADISSNVCIAKVNSDAKISSIENHYLKDLMSNIEDPCESNSAKVTVGSDIYCVSNINVKAGQVDSRTTVGTICDTKNPSLGCCSNINTNDIPELTCVYNESVTEATEINYNFIGNEDFKTVGKCLFPSGSLTSNCNNFLKGCKQPYLCYEENYGNFCLQPLETQTCYFDDACPEGFSCVDQKCIASDSDTPNITGNSFINDAGLFYFDPTLNKYKRITIQPNDISQIETSYTGTKLILGQNYIDSNVSKICIYDELSFILYILTYISENNYSCKTININQVFTHKVVDIILDPDDNILCIIQENIITARKRSYQITEVGTSLTLNTQFSNLSIGTSVFYSGTSGTINDQNLYNISGICGSSLELEGVTSYDTNLKNGYIITYDNTMTFPNGEFSNDGGIGWCVDNVNNINYSWIQTGDMFQVTEGTIGVSGSIANIGPNVILNGTSLYFYSYISKENNYNYFTISDNYNASEGSAPFIGGNKYIGQSMTYSSEAKVNLYNNLVTYSITKIDENLPTNSTININGSQAYITKQGNSFDKNGMDVGGITYAFDSDTSINFKTYKNDNKNYMLINSQIETQVDERFNNSKFVNYAQKINYNIGTCWDNTYSYQYKDSNSTCWINFSYQNNGLLPYSNNFYNDNNAMQPNISFNAVTKLYPNTFNVQEDQDLNLYNNVTNNDTTQTGSNINIINESKFRKMESNYNTNDDPVENLTFKNVDNVFKIPPVPMNGNLVSQLESPKTDDNTFFPGQALVTFNNSKDIDLILKYGSSETAIVKEADLSDKVSGLIGISSSPWSSQFPQWVNRNDITDYGRFKIVNVSGKPQIILVITDIVSHEVSLNTEKLVCKVNRPLADPKVFPESDWKIDNSFEDFIYKDPSSWNFYLYNYIPLTYRTLGYVFTGSSVDQNYAFSNGTNDAQIFDSSPLYTSSKKNNFFSNTIFNRCSYNKLIFPRTENGDYIILNNFDGFGGKYDINQPNKTPLILEENQNNYNSNIIYYKSSSNVPGTPIDLRTVNEMPEPAVPPEVPAIPVIDTKLGTGYQPPLQLVTYGTFLNENQTNLNLSYFYPSSNFSFVTGNTFRGYAEESTTELNLNFINSGLLDSEQPLNDFLFGYNNFNETGSNTANDFINSFNFTSDQINYLNNLWSQLKTTNKYGITNYCSITGSIYTAMFGSIHKMLAKGSNIPNTFDFNKKLYTINNLFMSTLDYIDNLGNGKVIYNNQQLLNSFIVSNQSSSSGEKKNKGSLKLNIDSSAIAIQKNNDPVITQLDQTNINAIDWPSWINLLNNNNNKYDHKIESVFYSSGNNNELSKATYYVYTSYVNNLNQKSYQMYYFGVNETIQDQALNRGVTTGSATDFYTTKNLAMDSLTRRLYLIGNVKI